MIRWVVDGWCAGAVLVVIVLLALAAVPIALLTLYRCRRWAARTETTR